MKRERSKALKCLGSQDKTEPGCEGATAPWCSIHSYRSLSCHSLSLTHTRNFFSYTKPTLCHTMSTLNASQFHTVCPVLTRFYFSPQEYGRLFGLCISLRSIFILMFILPIVRWFFDSKWKRRLIQKIGGRMSFTERTYIKAKTVSQICCFPKTAVRQLFYKLTCRAASHTRRTFKFN